MLTRVAQLFFATILCVASLTSACLTWRTLTVSDGMDEPLTRAIEAGVPALGAIGVALFAASLLLNRRSYAWWGAACLIGSVVYMLLLVTITHLLL